MTLYFISTIIPRNAFVNTVHIVDNCVSVVMKNANSGKTVKSARDGADGAAVKIESTLATQKRFIFKIMLSGH